MNERSGSKEKKICINNIAYNYSFTTENIKKKNKTKTIPFILWRHLS